MSHNITVEGGTSVRLPTAGKYCDRDIVVTAQGGTEDLDAVLTEQEALIVELQDTLRGKAAGGGDPKALLDASLNNTLTSIDSTVTSVIGHACRGLTKLKTVNLPNATSIGTYAFYGCTAMISFNAPKVTSLGTYSLYNCKMESVNFPLATGITQNAFYNCLNLEKADFGVASKINQAAFGYCESLVALILRRTSSICTLSVATNAFSGTPIAEGTGYVYVPAALIETYKTATNWTNYASQFRAIEDYPEICGEVVA